MFDYEKIGREYGIKVHLIESGDQFCQANGEDRYVEASYCAGREEIFLGIYEDPDRKAAAFFHELGHCISRNLKGVDCLTWHIELDAWMVGLTEAYRHGYYMKPSTFEYMIECLQTYQDHEERECVPTPEILALINRFK